MKKVCLAELTAPVRPPLCQEVPDDRTPVASNFEDADQHVGISHCFREDSDQPDSVALTVSITDSVIPLSPDPAHFDPWSGRVSASSGEKTSSMVQCKSLLVMENFRGFARPIDRASSVGAPPRERPSDRRVHMDHVRSPVSLATFRGFSSSSSPSSRAKDTGTATGTTNTSNVSSFLWTAVSGIPARAMTRTFSRTLTNGPLTREAPSTSQAAQIESMTRRKISSKQRLSFPGEDVAAAEAFVRDGAELWKFARTGCLSWTPKRFLHMFYVKDDTLHWDSRKSKKENLIGGRIFLSDVHYVSAHVLDDPNVSHSGNNGSWKWASSWRNSSSKSFAPNVAPTKSSKTRVLSQAMQMPLHGFLNEELHFEIVYRADDDLQEKRLHAKAKTRRDLKQWVTGLEHLVNCSRENMSGLNVEAMSRIMFRKADWNASGLLSFDEVAKLLRSLGMESVDWHCEYMFNNYDKDHNGEIGEDEFVSFFESLMLKKVLRDYFYRFSAPVSSLTLKTPFKQSSTSFEKLSVVSSSKESMSTSRREDEASVLPTVSEGTDPSMMYMSIVDKSSTRYDGRVISADGLCRFLLEVQEDPDASEKAAASAMNNLRGMPGAGRAVAKSFNALTEIGFSLLICSDLNMLIDPMKARVSQDMSLPLCRYWISSSHNTYLEGKQIAGRASVSQYLEVLMRGCRCIEIDVWDGKDGNPVVTHAYMSKPWLPFQDVVRACRDHAFQVSEFPLIISLEQHCSDEQKVQCGLILSETFGEMLLRLPPQHLTSFQDVPLTSPQDARGKVIVKGKIAPIAKKKEVSQEEEVVTTCRLGDDSDEEDDNNCFGIQDEEQSKTPLTEVRSFAEDGDPERRRNNSKDSTKESGNSTSSNAQASEDTKSRGTNKDRGKAHTGGSLSSTMKRIVTLPLRVSHKKQKSPSDYEKKISKGLAEYNRCIYLQAKKFKDAHMSNPKERAPCNCASLNEKAMHEVLKAWGPSISTYHQDNLSRVYPGIHSSNVKPALYWLHGAQMVALNYQNIDEAMLLNEGIFRYQNGGCGYVQKPETVNRSACFCPQGHRMMWTNSKEPWICSSCGGSGLAGDGLDNGSPRGSPPNSARDEPPAPKSPHSNKRKARSCHRCNECFSFLCEACANLQSGDSQKLNPMTLRLRLLSGHFLPRPQKVKAKDKDRVSRGSTASRQPSNEQPISPYIYVSIHGVEGDNARQQTRVQKDNGFDPVWDETFVFEISRPDVAIVTFQVYDSYSKGIVVAAAYPVCMLRAGIRWAPMWDYKLRDLEHCGLLVEIRFPLPSVSMSSIIKEKQGDRSRPSADQRDCKASIKEVEEDSLHIFDERRPSDVAPPPRYIAL